VAAVSLTACTTTQQEAARLQINSARLRASQEPLQLSGREPQVTVVLTTLIRGGSPRRSAIVVNLRNRGPGAVSDLPLLVGVTVRHGRRIYLDAAAGMDYFESHVPAIPGHGSLRWVLRVTRPLPTVARPFAKLGTATVAPAGAIRALPLLRMSWALTGTGEAVLSVRNLSPIPQYQVPVYAVALRGGRYVAAGQATIEELDSGANAQLRVPLVGSPSRAKLWLQAPPTIFN
jgi:hypothetical protein